MNFDSSWAVDELAKVDFGDKRLDKRFLKVASSQGKTPSFLLRPHLLIGLWSKMHIDFLITLKLLL